jgi:2-(1,2-epoxy-1,2-dihydrophenyl)acetyl-CoA isomerase
MSDILSVTRHEHVTLLTITRPQVRNALNKALADELRKAVIACNEDGTRCIVITGEGGAFKMLTDHYAPMLKAIRNSSWPVIAAVDGYAAGIGCDLACVCDIRLVSARGTFAELFVRIGLIPDGGGTYLLPRLVGLGRAMEMMFTGADVDAETAVQIGLANHVYPTESFMQEVMAYATRISQQAPNALRRGKAAMLASLDSNYADALAREAANQRAILQSEDGFEGFRAFVEKRAPKWTGR